MADGLYCLISSFWANDGHAVDVEAAVGSIKSMCEIAHPDDREALERAACERFGYSFLHLK